MDRPLVACVLAGGTGTRLYPASTGRVPKQFRSFSGEKSLLARTIDRVAFADRIYVLTRAAFTEQVGGILADADVGREAVTVLAEPDAKDTGPALVYAAHRIGQEIGDCVLLSVPSDHHVADRDDDTDLRDDGDRNDDPDTEGGFEATMREAARVAVDTEGLVTIGVEPTRAATGYGYLKPTDEDDADEVNGEKGDAEGTGDGKSPTHTRVETFREKPDPGAAARYVHHGYLWNAGIFAWTPAALLDAARGTDLGPLVASLDASEPEHGFASIDPVSVDHAVLEPAAADGAVYVVRASFEWDDLGAWDAFERVHGSDENGNTVLGEALLANTSGTIVASDADTHVSVLGVSDLVVAAYDDRVLVVPKDDAQRVREVVTELKKRGLR